MAHSSSSFKTVESIGRTLPDVEVTTAWGQPALKVRGKMFVCIASHKSAESNTLAVMMDFADRDALFPVSHPRILQCFAWRQTTLVMGS